MTTLTAAEPVRAHVQKLRSAGASWQAIGSAAGVGAMTVFDVVNRNARVSQTTAEALLAVDQRDLELARVDANGAMLRLRSLQAMGHSSARVARAIGCHQQSIQRIVSGQAPTISIRLHRAIASVFDAWWDKAPPERTRSERAAASATRRRAEQGGWCQAAALDEELLDTPGYQPFAGYQPARGTGIAPEIRLARISDLDAKRSYRPRQKGAPPMSHAAQRSQAAVTPLSGLSAVRSVECWCKAEPGASCTQTGDHLERYVRAAKQGSIDRQTLKQAVAGLDVIAPQAIVRPPDKPAAGSAPKVRELEPGA